MLAPTLAIRVFSCRRCGGRVPAGPLPAPGGDGSRAGPRPGHRSAVGLVLDRACPGCGHRALYRADEAVTAPA